MRIGCSAADGDVSALADCGYDYVELPGRWVSALPEARLWKLAASLEDKGLPCEAFNAYCSPEITIVGEGFDLNAARAYAKRCARAAAIVGAKVVGIGSPLSRKVSPGYDRAKAFAQMRDFFAATADEFAQHSVLVGIEPLGRCYARVLNTLAEAQALCAACGRDNLGLVVDFYNLEHNDEADHRLLPYADYLVHAHLSDDAGNPWRRWFLDVDKAETHQRRLQRLSSIGYSGRVTVEIDLPAQGEAARQTLAIIRGAWTSQEEGGSSHGNEGSAENRGQRGDYRRRAYPDHVPLSAQDAGSDHRGRGGSGQGGGGDCAYPCPTGGRQSNGG